ncbi:hypothetical protein R3X25_00625 [Lutibacter sp. TH_r2]|uniref:hypothetical protein n=1 Tax=Lutibacter sp. TH_r2 TaxID=3082083 RepID=UPI00295350DB|nr:hypothetical protein [Lutibacter sp. TH_r2]MDV7185769.1 hypothetical protein [Lutibacter sp. TH_r2]
MKYILGLVFVFFSVVMVAQENLAYRGEFIRKAIIKENLNVVGKDYIYNEYNKGMLVLHDSIFSKQDYLKYDIYNDRVLIKYDLNSNDVLEISDNSLTAFSIFEIGNNLKHDFVRLFGSSFEDGVGEGFYEIVYNLQNTNYFIKKNAKIIFDPNRSKGSQTENNLPREFKDKNTYYIKNNEGLYAKVLLKKKSILKVLNKHPKLVSSFIKGKKINFRKESDVIKLVNYYKSL